VWSIRKAYAPVVGILIGWLWEDLSVDMVYMEVLTAGEDTAKTAQSEVFRWSEFAGVTGNHRRGSHAALVDRITTEVLAFRTPKPYIGIYKLSYLSLQNQNSPG
jgi:hypothetical protein